MFRLFLSFAAGIIGLYLFITSIGAYPFQTNGVLLVIGVVLMGVGVTYGIKFFQQEEEYAKQKRAIDNVLRKDSPTPEQPQPEQEQEQQLPPQQSSSGGVLFVPLPLDEQNRPREE